MHTHTCASKLKAVFHFRVLMVLGPVLKQYPQISGIMVNFADHKALKFSNTHTHTYTRIVQPCMQTHTNRAFHVTYSLLLVLINVQQFKECMGVRTGVCVCVVCVSLRVKWRQAGGRLSDNSLRPHKHSNLHHEHIKVCFCTCVFELLLFPLCADKPQMERRWSPSRCAWTAWFCLYTQWLLR